MLSFVYVLPVNSAVEEIIIRIYTGTYRRSYKILQLRRIEFRMYIQLSRGWPGPSKYTH